MGCGHLAKQLKLENPCKSVLHGFETEMGLECITEIGQYFILHGRCRF